MLNCIIAVIIFFIAFTAIFSEKIHRTIAALAGAIGMVITGKILGFYGETQALQAIDFNTLGLLLGMMILLALLKETGFMELMAVWIAQKTKGNPYLLLVTLGAATSVISMFLDNVTTVILVAPVTLIIAQKIKINAMPLLLSEALLSNIGGVATLVGDPPNIMIGSAAKLSFNSFLIFLGPAVIIIWLVSVFLLKLIFKNDLKTKPRMEELMKINPDDTVRSHKKLKRTLFCLAVVIILFFAHNYIRISPSFVALFGASLALLLIRPNIDTVLKDVEWSVLLFFAALFILVGGLEASGALSLVGGKILFLAKENLFMTVIVLLWSAVIASAIIDNIPFTMAVIPIIQYLAGQGVNAAPLWWALALGAGLGGNGTPIGATANVVVVNLSEKTQTPITFKTWMKSGLIITFASGVIATLWLVLMFEFMK